jgi:hypothetical protein
VRSIKSISPFVENSTLWLRIFNSFPSQNDLRRAGIKAVVELALMGMCTSACSETLTCGEIDSELEVAESVSRFVQ